MITLISGTNREGSRSLQLTRYLDSLYQAEGEQTRLLDLSQLPADLIRPTVYGDKPEALKKDFIEPILGSSGLHLVVAEYNGSFPGILKYFIDLLPYPEAFEGRPVAFTGIAAGQFGALRPVEQLQQVFGYRNAHLFPRRVFIPASYEALDASGKPGSEDLAERLLKQVREFMVYSNKLYAAG